MSIIVFDTETTGVPRDYKKSVYDVSGNWPDLVSLSWIVYKPDGSVFKRVSHVIKPAGWTIPADSTAIHGITHAHAVEVGADLRSVLGLFTHDLMSCRLLVAHNIDFDVNVLRNALHWWLGVNPAGVLNMPLFCTMKTATNELKLPAKNGGKGYKWPGLDELYRASFGVEPPGGAHESLRDAEVCGAIYWRRWVSAASVASGEKRKREE